jgi:hypothetical protein
LTAFLSLSAVCASDINETDNTVTAINDDDAIAISNEDDVISAGDDDEVSADSDNATLAESEEVAVASGDDDVMSAGSDDELAASKNSKKASFIPTATQVYVKNNKVVVKLVDENKKSIVNKTVQVTFKKKVYNLTTDNKGKFRFKLKTTGNYEISYSFNQPGYVPVSGSKKVTVVEDTTTKISGSNYVAYVGVKNPYTVNLTVGGIALPYQNVVFRINGTYYTKKTDANGQATLNINLPEGTYKVKYFFKGTTNANFAKDYSKIKVKTGMPTKIVKLNSPVFKEKVSTALKFKYFDARGNPINKQKIVLKVNGVKYKKVTDANGYVKFKIKLNAGKYNVRVYSYNTVYKHTENQYSITVKSLSKNNYGFWVFGADMKSVNLKTMANNGINQIFLNFYAVKLHGKAAVESFATEAKSLGINVHIWMQAFYNGGWLYPVDDSGNYNYALFDSIIAEAKEYAAIKGVAGIHFDYLRFPGTAYKHANGVEAINYFTKKVCDELHKQYPNIIMSAAVMPEPSGMIYYYGQDIPTISQYLDVIVPMVYKGNYNAGTSWVTSTTQKFVEMSKGAEIWTGLQSYYSDDDVSRLPVSTLKKDSQAGLDGGAKGVITFRFGLFNIFDFDDL